MCYDESVAQPVPGSAGGLYDTIWTLHFACCLIGRSLKTLTDAGYDIKPLQQLVKSSMGRGKAAMSLAVEPTGAALGDGAFSSQQMLDHTLEEELLHLNQDLAHTEVGPATADLKEAEVDAARKISPPQPPPPQ